MTINKTRYSMRTKTLFALLLLFILQVTPVLAQQQPLRNFRVVDFHQDAVDLTARNEQFKKTDDSGSLYAIIKVKTDLPDDDLQAYRFDFGMMNSFVEFHGEDRELWVYVQKNARTVTIRREGFTSVNKYDLRTTIEAGATYVMQLSVSAPQMYVQMVMFQVKPELARAVIMVKSEREGSVEELFGIADETGSVAKSLPLGSYTYRVAAENFYPSEGRFILNNQDETHTEDITLRTNYGMITLQVDADADIYVDGVKKGTRAWMGVLKAGRHQVECRQEGHKPSSQAVTIAEDETRTITLVPPTPLTGTLSITSKPLGANIMIDDQNFGLTPKVIKNLLVGQHTVTLTKANYNPESKPFEVKEKETTKLEVALTKASSTNLIADDASSTPFQKPTCFYVTTGVQLGPLMAANLNLGAYISNFNIEVCGLYGFMPVKGLAWNKGTTTWQTNYRPLSVGVKLGYGINMMHDRLRLTPQAGWHFVTARCFDATMEIYGERASDLSYFNGSTGVITAGLRADYAFSRHFGIYIAPEWNIPVELMGNVYEKLAEVSSDIKTWTQGINVRLGVRVSF